VIVVVISGDARGLKGVLHRRTAARRLAASDLIDSVVTHDLNATSFSLIAMFDQMLEWVAQDSS